MKWVKFVFGLLFSTVFFATGTAQSTFLERDFSLIEYRTGEIEAVIHEEREEENSNNEYPSPRSVMYKSLMIPGWGQIENRQIWKVPIVYGLFAGVGFYTVFLNDQYQEYRAAYYNSFPDNDDERFGPTPERLQGINANQLQSERNSLRNQRDFMFVVMGLAYGLQALDAYVYAHMRNFDVSDDLSATTTVGPTLMADGRPGVSLRLTLNRR